MTRVRDFYGILGVPRNASASAIKHAYRQLVKRLHPDTGRNASNEGFRDVQTAYENLIDGERRRRYDEALCQAERRWSDAQAWPFTRAAAIGDLRRPAAPHAVAGEIILSPAEAARGGEIHLDVPIGARCAACEGSGGLIFDCPDCCGDGVIEIRHPLRLIVPPGVKDGTALHACLDRTRRVVASLVILVRPF
jgi:DnaJ-class molecular chaperone